MKVVAISGVSGSGKTSIIKQLAAEFASPYLLFDDHTDENTYPTDMKQWFDLGANVSEIKTPSLITSLHHLTLAATNKFIFIEEPFGRCRESMSSCIDYVVLLDMPMEVCLSRVIRRHIKSKSRDSLTAMSNYLSRYDDHFRAIYIAVNNQVRDDSDLIIQEVQPLELTLQVISNWLQSNANG